MFENGNYRRRKRRPRHSTTLGARSITQDTIRNDIRNPSCDLRNIQCNNSSILPHSRSLFNADITPTVSELVEASTANSILSEPQTRPSVRVDSENIYRNFGVYSGVSNLLNDGDLDRTQQRSLQYPRNALKLRLSSSANLSGDESTSSQSSNSGTPSILSISNVIDGAEQTARVTIRNSINDRSDNSSFSTNDNSNSEYCPNVTEEKLSTLTSQKKSESNTCTNTDDDNVSIKGNDTTSIDNTFGGGQETDMQQLKPILRMYDSRSNISNLLMNPHMYAAAAASQHDPWLMALDHSRYLNHTSIINSIPDFIVQHTTVNRSLTPQTADTPAMHEPQLTVTDIGRESLENAQAMPSEQDHISGQKTRYLIDDILK